MDPLQQFGASSLIGANAMPTDTVAANPQFSPDFDGKVAEAAAYQRMGFLVGNLGLLTSSDSGREVMTPPAVSRIPGTVSWLRGVANVRGGLVPIVDTAAAFGITVTPGTPVYLLISGHGDAAMGILIHGLPRLLNIDDADRAVEPPEVPALLHGNVTAAYRHRDRLWLEVDLPRLFDSLAGHIAL